WTGNAAPLDYNEDGWTDLYVLSMQGHDQLYENVRGEKFEKKSREVFPRTSWGAMGIQVFDFDNDGHQDIFITDMHSDMSQEVGPNREKLKSDMKWPESMLQSGGMSIFGNTFFRGLGGGRFEEVSDRIGAENYWPWGLSAGDLNADGFIDVFIASSMNFPFRYGVNSLLLNDGGKRFEDSEFILGVEPRRDGRTAKPWFKLDPAGEDKDHAVVREFNLKEPVEV
ncbi:MAG: VCBS repeat-containing protein, partial [Akkermansiaceae bacterium]|nr:VCBS repeat-containing protein [Akkermansiaceae bacterium]